MLQRRDLCYPITHYAGYQCGGTNHREVEITVIHQGNKRDDLRYGQESDKKCPSPEKQWSVALVEVEASVQKGNKQQARQNDCAIYDGFQWRIIEDSQAHGQNNISR